MSQQALRLAICHLRKAPWHSYKTTHTGPPSTQFDRERIPERVVHARGASAKGFFEVRGWHVVMGWHSGVAHAISHSTFVSASAHNHNHSNSLNTHPGDPRHLPPHVRRLPARARRADARHRALLNRDPRAVSACLCCLCLWSDGFVLDSCAAVCRRPSMCASPTVHER